MFVCCQGQAQQQAILDKNSHVATAVCWNDGSTDTEVLFDKDGLFTNTIKL